MKNARKIPLTKGEFAIVDQEDYDELMKYRWHASPKGDTFYARRNGGNEDVRTVRMHRQIMGITDRNIHIDHINHNGLDNRRKNLRICSNRENIMNQRPSKHSKSKYIGVHFRKDSNKWVCRIGVKGKRVYGGQFDTEIEAAKARDVLSKKYFGEFAYLNFKG